MSDSPSKKAVEDPFAGVFNVEKDENNAASADLISMEPSKDTEKLIAGKDNDSFVEQAMTSPSKITNELSSILDDEPAVDHMALLNDSAQAPT